MEGLRQDGRSSEVSKRTRDTGQSLFDDKYVYNGNVSTPNGRASSLRYILFSPISRARQLIIVLSRQHTRDCALLNANALRYRRCFRSFTSGIYLEHLDDPVVSVSRSLCKCRQSAVINDRLCLDIWTGRCMKAITHAALPYHVTFCPAAPRPLAILGDTEAVFMGHAGSSLNWPDYFSPPFSSCRIPPLSKFVIKSRAMEHRWQPLDKSRQEIRVLDLDAGTGQAPLSAQLRHVFLDEPDKPKFETISYAWGDTALVKSISLCSWNLPIPKSAASALRCVRRADRQLALWVDCICIDQNDGREKGHQVSFMANIYTISLGTFAFLGDSDGSMRHAFRSFRILYNALKNAAPECMIYLPDVDQVKLQDRGLVFSKLDWPAISRMVSRPYFRYETYTVFQRLVHTHTKNGSDDFGLRKKSFYRPASPSAVGH